MRKPKTINDFIQDYGVTQQHLQDHGISYHASLKYGDTPIQELPKKFRDAFVAVLLIHGVKV
jgi:hypothetical protein